jgi:drug/metabolite transporter (DMT)-like permease
MTLDCGGEPHQPTPRTLQRMERWLATERNVRICAVLGAVAIAFSSILVRLSHASPSTAAIFRCAYALPLLWLIANREDRKLGRRPWRQRGPAIASGVFFAADLLLWHRSIGDVGAGLATVLANVQVVLVPLVAWAILSERPGRQVLAALPVSLLGVLLISGALEHGAYGRNPTRGTVFGLGAGVAYVGFLLLLRRGGADLRRPAGPLFDATATATVLCVVAGVVIGDAKLVPSWPSAGWLITLALTSQVLGWLLITSSLPRLPAALTSLLLTVQPVGSVALGALIFGESPSGLQLIGVAVILVALLGATRPRAATEAEAEIAAPVNAGPPGQAIAGASGNRSSAARMSSSENSGSSSSPARKAS